MQVDGVEVLDAHSGTTGRARVGLTGAADPPASVFVKLQPFSPEQRGFLRKVGLGVAEARLYEAMGNQLPVRIPRVWHAACDAADGSFVMVLEDLAASGCRFPTPADDDVLTVATSLMEEPVIKPMIDIPHIAGLVHFQPQGRIAAHRFHRIGQAKRNVSSTSPPFSAHPPQPRLRMPRQFTTRSSSAIPSMSESALNQRYMLSTGRCGPQTAVDAALTAVIPNGMEGICQVR